MNSLIILPHECVDASSAVLLNERAQYAFGTHEVRVGDVIKVAVLGGKRGEGQVIESSPQRVVLSISLVLPALPPKLVDLVVGLPRPQTIRKVVQAGVMFGVRSLHFVRTELGEKSYLMSTALSPESLEEEAVKAIEQIWDSRVPEIRVHRSFKHFCENRLPMLGGTQAPIKIVAHPTGESLGGYPALGEAQEAVLAVGPERGWSEAEVGEFLARGFRSVGLGERVLRVELALTSLLGQIDLLRLQGSAPHGMP